MEIAVAVLAGFILDCIFGDPAWIPHPIRFIGALISGCEKVLRRIFPGTDRGELIAGAFLTVTVVMVSSLLPLLIIWLAAMIDYRLAFAVNTFWCWQIFAARSLKKESMRVCDQIEKNDISLARKFLSWIVGRDTADLDFREITKAVVETVAENTSDGVTAPMLFMIIGGAPLGFFYKAANTLDSMVGYKNDKYLYFGRASARFDDLLNFIPARITGLAMVAAAWLTGLDGRNSMKMFRRDRLKHVSPNSGNLEAACAGALDIQLGGDACYFGKLYKKETLGDPLREAEPEDIRKAVKLMYGTSVLLLIIMEAVRIGLVALL